MSENRTVGYLGIRMSPDGKIPSGWLVTDSLTAVADWKASPSGKTEKDSASSAERKAAPLDSSLLIKVSETSLGKDCINQILRFRDEMESYIGLIAVASVAPKIFGPGLILSKLIPFAKDKLSTLESENNITIYEYNYDQYLDLIKVLREIGSLDDGMRRLPSAILLSLVATFDSFFADIVRLFLSAHPERFDAKPIALRDIMAMDTIADAVQFAIENEIDDLMRGSHREQVEFVERKLNIEIVKQYPRWNDFIEIFERRNIAAHGSLIANGLYVRACKDVDLESIRSIKSGDVIEISGSYLERAVDILTEFGALLIFTLWLKNEPDSSESAFRSMNELCFGLISQKRYSAATWLLEYLTKIKSKNRSDAIMKMMIVNLANAYKKGGNDGACSTLISKTDWSSAGNAFKICVASLRGEVDRVVSLIPTVVAAREISARDFRNWPVLDWVRDEPRVLAAAKLAYGDELEADAQKDVGSQGGVSIAPPVAASSDSDNTD